MVAYDRILTSKTIMPHWIGLTLSTLGELCIAVIVLKVHRDVLREGKIGKMTRHDLKLEMTLGVAGIALIIAGYVIQLYMQ